MSYGVSFIIPTLNSQKTLSRCLSSIEKQKYPKSKIEVLILDGGSDDTTCDIAKKFKHLNLKFIKAGLRNNMEGRRLVGFKKAKHDFVCILDSDNYLGERNWISKMMKPLEDNDDLVGSFTLHYHYDSKQTPFGRYLSLFGGHDPVSYYLGKTDRQKWTTKKWGKKSQIKSKNKFYTLVQFSHSNFPTLGSNGFIIRRKFIHFDKLKPEQFFHTDILYDLLEVGRNSYAVVDTSLIHDVGSSTIYQNVLRRVEYMRLHHLDLAKHRRYKVFDKNSPKDVANLVKYIFYTITLIQPLGESIIGYIKLPDLAWFLHPVACWMFLVGYSYAVVENVFRSSNNPLVELRTKKL